MKLETNHRSYASFKVEVTCDYIPDMYDPEKWPVGAYIRRHQRRSLLDRKLRSVLSTVMNLKASSRVLKPWFPIAIHCVCTKLC